MESLFEAKDGSGNIGQAVATVNVPLSQSQTPAIDQRGGLDRHRLHAITKGVLTSFCPVNGAKNMLRRTVSVLRRIVYEGSDEMSKGIGQFNLEGSVVV